MGKYADNLQNRMGQRTQARQRQLRHAAAPTLVQAPYGDAQVWTVQAQGLISGAAANSRKLYWPLDRYVPVHGVRNGHPQILAFGLDYGPLGLGRLYVVDLSPKPIQHHAETLAEFAPNPYGLVQVPATLSKDAQDRFYIILAYLAAPGTHVAADAPTGALLRMELGPDSEPVLLHTFLPDQGQPACLPPQHTAASRAIKPAWLQEAPNDKLLGSLVAGAPRHWPPTAAPMGRPAQYEINKDGSGFQLLPADSHVQDAPTRPLKRAGA